MEFDTEFGTQLDTELDALEAAMDVVATGDFSQYADCESQLRIQSLQSKMDYIRAKSIAAFDLWGAWGASGARSAKSYVAKECQIPNAEAARQLRRGQRPAGAVAGAAEIIDHDLCAPARQSQRMGAPETIARAGNDSDAAVKPDCHD